MYIVLAVYVLYIILFVCNFRWLLCVIDMLLCIPIILILYYFHFRSMLMCVLIVYLSLCSVSLNMSFCFWLPLVWPLLFSALYVCAQ